MSRARYILYSGTAGGFAVLAALLLAAKAEGKAPLQPINATSHWLHGDHVGSFTGADIPHTAVGIVTNIASAIFWAVPFGWWLSGNGPRRPLHLICGASLLSAFAALFDYGVIHRRLTPGWELALSKRSVASGFAALALGLAAGAWAAQRER